MKRLLIFLVALLTFTIVGGPPAHAAYGNEVAYNLCESSRGIYAYNTGYFENRVLLGPCDYSSNPRSHGYQDIDRVYISKEDICVYYRHGSAGSWIGPFKGIGHIEAGEVDLYVKAGTVVPFKNVCNFST